MKIKYSKFIPIISAIAITVPTITITATSCGSVYGGFSLTKTMSIEDAYNNENLLDASDYVVNAKDLLYGNSNNGDYMFFIGSTSNDKVNQYFTSSSTARAKENWSSNWTKGIFYNTINKIQAEEEIEVKTPMYFNIDFASPSDFPWLINTDKTMIEIVDPFKKWDQPLIDINKNKPEGVPESAGFPKDYKIPKEGEYIRNDSSAKAMRAFYDLTKSLYPDSTFDTNNGYVFFFHDHKMQTNKVVERSLSINESIIEYYKVVKK